MARLMLSAGMFSALAAAIAVLRRGLVSGSPPLFAAMLISLIRRVKILPRLASSAPFLCLIVAHFEWPDMRDLEEKWLFRIPRTPKEGLHGAPERSCRANHDYNIAMATSRLAVPGRATNSGL